MKKKRETKHHEKVFVLERARYYRETPAYESVGVFTSVALAEKYLRSRLSLCGERLIPHWFLKNAKLCYDKDEGIHTYHYNDDGVTTAYRLRHLNVISCDKEIPPCVLVRVGIDYETRYYMKDGVTKKKRKYF